MTKRIFEYAKEKNVPNKQLIEILHKLGFDGVKTHFNVLEPEMAKKLDEYFSKGEKKPEPPKEAAHKAPAAPAKPAEQKPAPAPAAPAAQKPAAPVQAPPAAHKPAAHKPAPAVIGAPNRTEPRVQQPVSVKPAEQRPVTAAPARPAAPSQTPPAAHKPSTPAAAPPKVESRPQAPQAPHKPAEKFQQPAQRPQPQAPAAQQPGRPAPAPAQQQPHHPAQHHVKHDRDRHGVAVQEKPLQPPAPAVDESKVIKIPGPLSVKEMCDLIHIQRIDVIKKLMNFGIMNVNARIPVEVVSKIAEEFKYVVMLETQDHEKAHEEADDHSKMVLRPPIVTIMGHVDHGKTSLLDAIRKTNVVATEDGGITQHIGAYQVELPSGGQNHKITFLDTPGHEAFTQMRAHGSKVTDIAILVVSADDGVQPQTIEAIDHAIAAEIPIIVAVNKIDKPGANVDNVKKQLAEHGLVPEDWGGDTVCVEVSAKQRINIDSLLEMIILVAEMRQLKADPTRKAIGVVIESKLDRGLGSVASILVQKGTLCVGDPVIVGHTFGKIRSMTNAAGARIQKAPPSTPVEIVGLSEVPQAGDKLKVVATEKLAREIAMHRQVALREERMKLKKHVSLTDLFKEIQTGKVKDLNIILKGDVAGSLIALSDSLRKLTNDKVRVNVIHSNVGAITENDVLLAAASNALIIGFRVRPTSLASTLAETEKVDVKVYRIIYDAIDQIQHAMVGLYEPAYKEVVMGRAEVKQLFKVPHIGVIAGSQVKDGKIVRDSSVRVVRGGIEIYEGKIKSLRRFKDDAKEVGIGMECGIGLDKFSDLKEGDVLEAFEMQEIKQTYAPAPAQGN